MNLIYFNCSNEKIERRVKCLSYFYSALKCGKRHVSKETEEAKSAHEAAGICSNITTAKSDNARCSFRTRYFCVMDTEGKESVSNAIGFIAEVKSSYNSSANVCWFWIAVFYVHSCCEGYRRQHQHAYKYANHLGFKLHNFFPRTLITITVYKCFADLYINIT